MQKQMHRLRRTPAGLLLCALLSVSMVSAGCYSSSLVPAQSLVPLTRPGHRTELVVRDTHGSSVRIGPNSRIRFLLRGYVWSPWVDGSELVVDRLGASVQGPDGAPQRLALWSEIYAADVVNLSGGRTYGALLAATLLVGVVVLMIAGGGKGKGGGKLLSGVGRAGARASAHALYGGLRLGVIIAHGARPPSVEQPPGDASPAPPPADPTTPPDESGTPPPPPAPPPAPGETVSIPAPLVRSQHAFSGVVRRQSRVRFLGALEGGSDLTMHDGGSVQALLGLRIYDALELGLGARMLVHRGTRTATPQTHRSSWMAVLRVNAHLDLDANRRVALPLGFDVGTGQATVYVRMTFGLRVRVARFLHVGLYPFNPTYTRFKDDTLLRDYEWWSFPSSLDLLFTF
ncbi:MAG: hypothetical protein ABI333_21605 [bacterium]